MMAERRTKASLTSGLTIRSRYRCRYRKGPQGFGEQHDAGRVDGNFPHLGAEDRALNPHDVSDIPLFECCVCVLPHVVPPDINLHPVAAVPQIEETRLAHNPAAHHPPRDRDRAAFQFVKMGTDIRVVGGDIIFCQPEGTASGLLQGCQLIPADLYQFRHLLFGQFLSLGHAAVRFVHRFHILSSVLSKI